MSSNRKAGSALLTVLWLTAALSAIALAVASNVRGEAERASTNVDDAKAYFVAQGAINRAILHMQWGEKFYKFPAPYMDLDFPTALVHVEVIPETSKLQLNSAPPEELQRLLIALGQPEGKANEITAAILDWRTAVTPERESPFDPFYLQQSPSFLPPHTSFTQDEELLLVKGITPELFYGTSLNGSRAGLRDCVSIYGGAAVDVNTARTETLIAVGLSPQDADVITRGRATHPILDSREFGTLQQSLGATGGRLRIGGNTMFTLKATARLRQPDGKLSDLRRSVGALIKFYFPGNTQERAPGVSVVRWYDRI